MKKIAQILDNRLCRVVLLWCSFSLFLFILKRLCQPQAFRSPAGFHGVIGQQLLEDILPMSVHCIDADVERCSNFLAHVSAFNQLQNFQFTLEKQMFARAGFGFYRFSCQRIDNPMLCVSTMRITLRRASSLWMGSIISVLW